MDDKQVERLAELGLNSYEAKAYLALLGKDTFSATQVADLSGVPRQRIYDILASLVERGLAISRPGKRGQKYSAVSPKGSLSALLEQEQARLASLERTTESLISELSQQFQAGQEENSPLEYIQVLRGSTAIAQRFAEIQSGVKEEILIFTKPPYATVAEENVEGLEMLSRHVRACSLYEYSALAEPGMASAIAAFIEQGEEARFTEQLPLKLVIVDSEIVMFAMEDPIAGRTELTIMVIENEQLAHVMKTAFESYWQRAESFETAFQRVGGLRAKQPA